DLLELMLSCSEDIFFIPAHIWTPWFSALGAQSGFDSIDECYADLSPFIYAVETGLSSDPPMNWRCSFLDRFTLVSNSDAHSPEKLGRNANLFNTALDYRTITGALKTGNPEECLGTIDFFPQEGKYHCAGHRKCGVCLDPEETIRHRGICPVCNKPVTMGVLNRVNELADRPDGVSKDNRLPFYSLIPLKEILSEIYNSGTETKQIRLAYQNLIQKAGDEFTVLLSEPLSELAGYAHPVLVEAIRRMREGRVIIKPGYDGEFGQIRVFGKDEVEVLLQHESLFAEAKPVGSWQSAVGISRSAASNGGLVKKDLQFPVDDAQVTVDNKPESIVNVEQKQAIEHYTGPALVIAGPGTGKTRVLTQRIAHLIGRRQVNPEEILGITFTNKAAGEIRERMRSLSGEDVCRKLTLCTFHQLGYAILNEHAAETGRRRPFTIIGEGEKEYVLQTALAIDRNHLQDISDRITRFKQEVSHESSAPRLSEPMAAYQSLLADNNLFDLDDLIYEAVILLRSHPVIAETYRRKYQWILIDEYQDINRAQYGLIRLLAPGEEPNLFVIGDPNQAIYGFRGADVRFINRFRNDFATASVYGLTRSYRCSDPILRASQQVIYDTLQEPAVLYGMPKEVRVKVISHPTDRSEAEFVARTIEKMVGGLRFFSMDSQISSGDQEEGISSLSDFAVLCRIGRQMDVLEKAFADHSIPYQKVAEDPFFRQKPVRTILDLLKLARHHENWLLARKLHDEGDVIPFHPDQVRQAIQGLNVADAILALSKSFMKNPPDPDDLIMKRLLGMASGYGNEYESFLQLTELGTSADTLQAGTEGVRLMTLHASKGLEFRCVFIVGCEDGLLPFSLFEGMQSDPEEEKRLLYVGMTRAMKHLYLNHASQRSLMGKVYHLRRSSFLDQIEKDLMEMFYPEGKRKPQRDQLSLF
ncbi:MAG: UvrD-helicase domain-containing protein, partial [Bacteroidales bacterium]|nr:UvrD-helicase domain-containing protein [Bacteroidales bacterium]